MSRRVDIAVTILRNSLPDDIVKRLSVLSDLDESEVVQMTMYNICTVIQLSELLDTKPDDIYGAVNRGALTTCYPFKQKNKKLFIVIDEHFTKYLEKRLKKWRSKEN